MSLRSSAQPPISPRLFLLPTSPCLHPPIPPDTPVWAPFWTMCSWPGLPLKVPVKPPRSPRDDSGGHSSVPASQTPVASRNRRSHVRYLSTKKQMKSI